MKRNLLSGLCALFIAAAPAAAAQAASPASEAPSTGAPSSEATVVMIRLRGGDIYWGEVVDHNPEALTFQRLDTGGQVTLPWTFLDPEQDRDLRTRYGYVELGGEEILIQAEMLVLVDGQEVVGLVTGRTEEAVLFKSQGRTLAVPKTRIKSHVAGLQVPALDIYTKEELYTNERGRADLTTPAGQKALAEFCERIFDFEHALEHYQAAAELDPNFEPKELAVLIERSQVKVESQAQVDYLANVDHLSRRKKYEEALQALAAFDGLFPDSPLVTDRLKLEERVVKARDKHLRREVPKRWFAWMGRLAAKAAREMSYEESLAYLEETFGEEILQHVAEEMRRVWPAIEEDQVRQYFIERKRGRWKPASYGLGTWLLGEDAALAGGPETTQAEPESARDRERADLEDKINRFMRNQQMAKRNSASAEDEEEVASFWTMLSSSARRFWIIAYYAENSGQLDVRPKPELHNCSECGGTGAREVIYTGSAREGATSGMKLVTCETCHGIGRVRRIRYR